ncbi:MAG: alcohol dehydrogenase catalytic domain-containing protein, partial [Dehalococcoidia bacterium]|nr:alcohol dehydrogenase catalytic domain-containing protein [Dehalococcoidia bacterium]
MEAKAAIFRRPHEALTFESIELDDPAPREVLVRIVASGVCHSDLHFVDGGIPWRSPDPMVLGHEGAGVILAAGDQVTTVSPGDHVVGC